MAIKTISQFDAATPASNDKILFEQNGEGKSATLAELPISTKTQTALDTKVNTANVLTLEEIQASTNLTGKIASADSLKTTHNLVSSIFANGGRQLTSKDNMNNIPEGLYRQGGATEVPSNFPGERNAYILIIRRRDGGGYNAESYFQICFFVTSGRIYTRSIVPAENIYTTWTKL